MRAQLHVGLFVTALLCAPGLVRADFVLTGQDYLEIETEHREGRLFDESGLTMQAGAYVGQLHTYDSSGVEMLPYSEVSYLQAHSNSRIWIQGKAEEYLADFIDLYDGAAVTLWEGRVYGVAAQDNSLVNVLGGHVDGCRLQEQASLNISGGKIENLEMNSYRDSRPHINMTGGTITNWVSGRNDRIKISGGEVGKMEVGRGYGEATYSVVMTGGHVQDMVVGSSYYEGSGGRVEVVGGQIDNLVPYNLNKLKIEDSHCERIFAQDNQEVVIRNSQIGEMRLVGSHETRIGSGDTEECVEIDLLFATMTDSLTIDNALITNMFLTGVDTNRATMTDSRVEGRLGVSGDASLWVFESPINTLTLLQNSEVYLVGKACEFGEGLWLEGRELLGTGRLMGFWASGRPFYINIDQHADTAHLYVIPEPTGLALAGCGLVGLLCQRRRRRAVF